MWFRFRNRSNLEIKKIALVLHWCGEFFRPPIIDFIEIWYHGFKLKKCTVTQGSMKRQKTM